MVMTPFCLGCRSNDRHAWAALRGSGARARGEPQQAPVRFVAVQVLPLIVFVVPVPSP